MSVDTLKRRAHVAGLWYVAASLIGVMGLVVVPGKLVVDGDAAATAAHLRNMESLARLGMASNLASEAMFVCAVYALYRLFEGVDRHQARLLLILGALVSVPVMFVNELNELAALYLAKGDATLVAIAAPQRDALSYLFMQLHGDGIHVASVFWGLWLFPFGWLAIRSGFIPRLLGWLLLAAGVAWVADATAWLLFPQYADAVGRVAAILRKGELLMILWLVFLGARGPLARVPIPAGV